MSNESGRSIEIKKGEPVDRALKRLKNQLDSEGILEEMRRRRAFENTAERKRRKARTAPKRHKVRWTYHSQEKSVTKREEQGVHDLVSKS